MMFLTLIYIGISTLCLVFFFAPKWYRDWKHERRRQNQPAEPE